MDLAGFRQDMGIRRQASEAVVQTRDGDVLVAATLGALTVLPVVSNGTVVVP